jgi:hypothetical protein
MGNELNLWTIIFDIVINKITIGKGYEKRKGYKEEGRFPSYIYIYIYYFFFCNFISFSV